MRVEVAIVGGGLAGAAAAITLARSGRTVLLLERAIQPEHKVCGEFLSQEALASLRALGIEPAELGAVSIQAVRLAAQGSVSSSPLPFAAMSLSRKRLDAALLDHAAGLGVQVVRGANVQSIEPAQRENVVCEGWFLTAAGGDRYEAESVFLANGKHDLAGRSRPSGRQSDLVGFKTYLQLAPEQTAELAGHIELFLFRGGYGGLSLVEDGVANLCWVVKKIELQRAKSRWEQLLETMQAECPHLAERLSGAQTLLAKPLAISPIPYGYLRSVSEKGLWILGDQAAVVPSFTGDGMSIALHSGTLAATMYLEGRNANAYQARLYRELSKQVSLATAISRGLVWRPSRLLLIATARAWPGILGRVAVQTRIPASARLA